MAKQNSGFIGGLAAGAVATLLIGSAVTEYWLYGEGETPNLQPATGGIALVETPVPAQEANPQNATAPTSNPFVAGLQAIAKTNLRLYADATPSSLVLNLIAQGVTVTLTEPSDDYKSYPVERDGYRWVRIRAEDGLVGWVDADRLEIK